jgi:hypothetical protein
MAEYSGSELEILYLVRARVDINVLMYKVAFDSLESS